MLADIRRDLGLRLVAAAGSVPRSPQLSLAATYIQPRTAKNSLSFERKTGYGSSDVGWQDAHAWSMFVNRSHLLSCPPEPADWAWLGSLGQRTIVRHIPRLRRSARSSMIDRRAGGARGELGSEGLHRRHGASSGRSRQQVHHLFKGAGSRWHSVVRGCREPRSAGRPARLGAVAASPRHLEALAARGAGTSRV